MRYVRGPAPHVLVRLAVVRHMLRCVCACGPATTKHFVHFSSTRFSKLVLLKAEQGGSNHHTTLKAASSNWMRTRSSSHCYGYSDPTDSAILGYSNAFMISQKKQRLLRRQQFFLYTTTLQLVPPLQLHLSFRWHFKSIEISESQHSTRYEFARPVW